MTLNYELNCELTDMYTDHFMFLQMWVYDLLSMPIPSMKASMV